MLENWAPKNRGPERQLMELRLLGRAWYMALVEYYGGLQLLILVLCNRLVI